jgi:hypothetical protein
VAKERSIDLGQSSVNRGQMLFWCERYGVCEITNYIDAFGDDTLDPEDAVVAIVRVHQGCWLNIDLNDYPRDGAAAN